MKTIQMTIDESLLDQVDQVIHDLNTTRTAFISNALQMALRLHHIEKMEQQHAQGYAQKPAQPGEFDIWEAEQVWEES